MNATTTKPEALVSSPDHATICPDCLATGERYPGEDPSAARYFAHCPQCGTTDLLDVRSPFEVLGEAVRNAEAAGLDPVVRLGRLDVVERVRRVALKANPDHCSDCHLHAYRMSEVLRTVR